MAMDIFSESRAIEAMLRFCVAYVLIFAFISMDLIAFHVPYFSEIRPSFTLIGLYYWWIYRPTLTPSWLTFLIALAIDALSGLPLGVNALLLLGLQKVITDQRKLFMGQPFMTAFIGFCIVSALFFALKWLILSTLYYKALPISPILGAIILNMTIYAPLILLLNAVHRILPFEAEPVGTS